MRFLDVDISVPAEATHASHLVPALYALSDAMVREQERLHGPVRCGPGCPSCCRQLIPVSEPEVHALVRALGTLAPAHAQQVRARFAALVAHLEEEGLAAPLRSPPSVARAYEDMLADYLDLRPDCPFLEQERCSIYDQRPSVCREHNVWSEPAHCADPLYLPVVALRPRGHLALALAQVLGRHGRGRVKITPMAFALEWAEAHPEEALPAPAEQVLAEVVAHLQG